MGKIETKARGRRSSAGKGTFIYTDPRDNHAIWPGREGALDAFLGATYGGMQHKLKNAHSSNSEDAITWSCFDALRQVSPERRAKALSEIWELAYGDADAPSGVLGGQIEIGKTYGDSKEKTEVDASVEGDGVLVFIEAKLYSPMSQADGERKPHNQIARKVRVGALEAKKQGKSFYFLLLDLAPVDALRGMKPGVSLAAAKRTAPGFGGKWLTAYWFARYKDHPKILAEILDGEAFDGVDARLLATHMGWITWADVFKSVLRAVLPERV